MIVTRESGQSRVVLDSYGVRLPTFYDLPNALEHIPFSDEYGTYGLSLYDYETWDPHTNARLQTLHPTVELQARRFINDAYKNLGVRLRAMQVYRTYEKQAEYYNDPNVYAAEPGLSYHNYGLDPPPKYEKVS